MRVLVACEYSGITRDAFAALGHDAWSCDLLETERPGNHIVGDALSVLYSNWDLLIGHPPCTYISYAATKYWNYNGRVFKRLDALRFFADLLECQIPHICIENPLGCASAAIRQHDQIINPYYFGDSNLKRTCLWLKNLPPLVHINGNDLFAESSYVDRPLPIYTDKKGKKRYFTDAIGGSKVSGKRRSKSFEGIAKAMAVQWTEYLKDKL